MDNQPSLLRKSISTGCSCILTIILCLFAFFIPVAFNLPPWLDMIIGIILSFIIIFFFFKRINNIFLPAYTDFSVQQEENKIVKATKSNSKLNPNYELSYGEEELQRQIIKRNHKIEQQKLYKK